MHVLSSMVLGDYKVVLALQIRWVGLISQDGSIAPFWQCDAHFRSTGRGVGRAGVDPSVTHFRQREYQRSTLSLASFGIEFAHCEAENRWPDNNVGRIGVFYMRQVIETAPRDGSAIILVDDAKGTYDVAHWSPEAGEWVGENGGPTKITPSHWYPMPRDKYLPLESDGSSNPSKVGPSPAARAARYATSSVAAALVAAALIGMYFHAEVAAFVTRYAGQQDIFGGSTIGEQVAAQATHLPSQDSQKTDLSAHPHHAEADQASAQEAAQVEPATEASVPEARREQRA